MSWQTPEQFAAQATTFVLEHRPHGGWYEDEDGLHCVNDDFLVIPSPVYLKKTRRDPL